MVVTSTGIMNGGAGKEENNSGLTAWKWITALLKFKFEGVSEALQYLIKDAIIIKFDLKSGYHHITKHEDHQKYVCGIFLTVSNIWYSNVFHSDYLLQDTYFQMSYYG